MSTCRDGRSTAAARVTARQARDASKYFSVAPCQVLSCIEYARTLCYMSRLVYGLPTFYWEVFFLVPQISQKEFGNLANTNIKMVWPHANTNIKMVWPYHTVVSGAVVRVAGIGEFAPECSYLCQPDPFFS
jgi:hypothetical protein